VFMAIFRGGLQSLWMLFATFVFAIMGVCVKLASAYFSTSQIVLSRGVVGMIVIGTLMKMRGGTLRTDYPWHHAWRGLVGVVSLWLWFFSIAALPLATAMTLNYTSPIWMAAIIFVAGMWGGRNRFEWGMAAAIVASFIGVTMLLHPTFQADQWFSGLVALFSGMLAALAYLQVRALGRMGEPEYRVVFFFSVTGTIGGLLGVLIGPASASSQPAGVKGMLLLIAVGVCATVAQMAMTRAYRLGKTLVTANLQYTGIVFSTIWSIILWNDVLSPLAWSGILVIIGSGLITTFYHNREARAPVVAAEDVDPIAAEL